MTEEEQKAIEKMYEQGLVNVSKIAEPLINKYKELDCQQCQFVIEYLLADRQYNEEYVDSLEADIEIKDKVIEKMINWIGDRCFYSDDCGNFCEVIEDSCYNPIKDCENCIKQYFLKKVEEENE